MASRKLNDFVPGDVLSDFLAGLAIMDAFGLTRGFGHLSARIPSGLLITPALAPGLATAGELLVLAPDGKVLCVGSGRKRALETPLHLGIYERRPDVGALCRTHSPWAVAWGLRAEAFRPAHGFGLMLGGRIPYHPDGDLITTRNSGAAVAKTLGDSRGVFLKGNGLIVAGRTVREAVIRALYLEEACQGALRAGKVSVRARFSAAERKARSRWHEAELERAWAYYSEKASRSVPK